MEAAIAAIQFPVPLNELKTISQNIWFSIAEELRLYPKNKLNEWAFTSKQYLSSFLSIQDYYGVQKVGIGILTLYRLYLNEIEEIIPLINFLYSAPNIISAQFAAYCISKVSIDVQSSSEWFSSYHISKSFNFLVISSTDEQSLVSNLQILYELSISSPSHFVLQCVNAHEVLWIYCTHKTENIITPALLIMRRYLLLLVKNDCYSVEFIANSLFDRSISGITRKNKANPIGEMHIMISLFIHCSKFIIHRIVDAYQAVFPFFSSKKVFLRIHAAHCVSRIAYVDPSFFIRECYKSFFQLIRQICTEENASYVVKECIESIIVNSTDMIINDTSDLIEIMGEMSKSMSQSTINSLIHGLKALIQIYPGCFDKYKTKIWSIIQRIMVFDGFLELFSLLNSTVPSLWAYHSSEICEFVISCLQHKNNSLQALKLIPNIQSILPKMKKNVIELTKQYLQSVNPGERAAAPKALLHLTSTESPNNMMLIIRQVIISATSDSSLDVRLSVLSSFGASHYSVLSQSVFLPYLTNLSNDSNPSIRKKTFKLLQAIRQYSPLETDVVLRHSLLNSFYQMYSAKSMVDKYQMSKSLPRLLKASAQIFPLYAPTFLPIIINMLKNRGKALPTFDSSSSNALTKNLVLSLKVIVTQNPELFSSYLGSIIPVLTSILGEFSSKDLKIAIMDTLSILSESKINIEVFSIDRSLLDVILVICARDPSKKLRVKALKFLGLCGAISPRSIKGSVSSNDSYLFSDMFIYNSPSTFNDFFGKVIFNELMTMINDQSLCCMKNLIISSAVTVLSTISSPPIEYLDSILPIMLHEVSQDNENVKFEYLGYLQYIIRLAKQKILPYIYDILKTIDSLWNSRYLSQLISIITALVIEVRTDFSEMLNPLIPKIHESLADSIISNPIIASQGIKLLSYIAPSFPSIMPMILPQMYSILSSNIVVSSLKKTVLDSLAFFVQNGKPSYHTVMIFDSILPYIHYSDKELKESALCVLYSLFVKHSSIVLVHSFTIRQLLKNDHVTLSHINYLIDSISGSEVLSISSFPFIRQDCLVFPSSKLQKQSALNPDDIIQCFEPIDMASPKHWFNWRQKLMNTCIKLAPLMSISCCYELSLLHKPFSVFLFFPAFLSCWKSLNQKYHNLISSQIAVLIHDPNIPEEILQSIANLSELMERSEEPLNISSHELSLLFYRAKMHTLSFHHEEEKVINGYTNNLEQFLIQSHNTNRVGIIDYLLANNEEFRTKEWFNKLGLWQRALIEYTNNDQRNSDDFCSYISSARKMRRIDLIMNEISTFSSLSNDHKYLVASDFAEACFLSKNYQKMNEFTRFINPNNINDCVLPIISSIMNGQYENAYLLIEKSYLLIANEYSQYFKSTYNRAYPMIVICQVLHELSEIVQSRNNVNIDLWKNKLKRCDTSVDVWWCFLRTRMIAMPSTVLSDHNIAYLNLLLQERRYELFEPTLKVIYPNFSVETIDPKIQLLYLKYLWATGYQDMAFSKLQNAAKRSQNPIIIGLYIDWLLIYKGKNESTLQEVFDMLRKNQGGQLSQKWGSVNYLLFKKDTTKTQYAINAIQGFSKSISSNPRFKFSDIVQMLSIFLQSNSNQEIFECIFNSINRLSVGDLVEAIPQIVFMLTHCSDKASSVAHNILSSMMANNFDSLLWILLSCDKITPTITQLIEALSLKEPIIVSQAKMIRDGLIAAAYTSFEKVLDSPRESILGVICSIIESHLGLDKLFISINYNSIKGILENGDNYISDESYDQIISNCTKFINSLDKIRSTDISDHLPKYNGTKVKMPGMSSNISSFSPLFDVFPSQQHPRKVSVNCENGEKYKYLLKANNNVLLDQRIMQFLSFINHLISTTISLSSESSSARIIEVIPLSDKIGMFEWVEGADTYLNLITQYRISHKIDPGLELTLSNDLTFNLSIDKLMNIQRYESLVSSSSNSKSDDLRRIFWLRSPSSDIWLDRIINFQKSCSLMSIIGYIIGLGDRHPGNIMIDRNTGDMIHIDFGECFEISKNRDYFPETVPFRLTRMLVSAFGVGGVNGVFKPHAIRVYGLLVENCTVIANILEMFIHESLFHEPESQKTAIIQTEEKKLFLNEVDISPKICNKIDKLIDKATSMTNLSKMFSGWCPLW